MNPLELIATLSPQDRIKMQLMGLRPGNESDVRKYKSGVKLSSQEKIERAKTLFGESSNLGSSNEADINPISLQGREINVDRFEEITQPKRRNEKDIRTSLSEELKDYTSNSGAVFNTDDLMTLKRTPKPQTSIIKNLDSIKLEGFNLGKKYLNSFISNLQTPSTKTRFQLFKDLQVCLKTEVNYKTNPQAQQAFKEGVIQAERAMLKNLQ